MDAKTIEYALHVLDSQLANLLANKTDMQTGYYEGMKTMFNIMCSGGYIKNYNHAAINDFTGLHYLETVPKP